MQAQRLPASRGWHWIAEGYRLFRRNPSLLTFLVFSYWMILVAVNLVPVIGWIAASLGMPAMSVGVMNGCRALERSEPVPISTVFSGFQRNASTLITLGGMYLLATIGVLTLTVLIDGGLLLKTMLSGKPAEPAALDDASMALALQAALLMMVPVMMAFWFAPLLAAWAGCSAGKSLFFSLVASWRNWRAFLVYAAGVAVLSAILPGIVLGAFAVVSRTLLNIMVVALTLPLLFVFVPTLFASFYVSYRDVFATAPAGRSADGNADAPAS